MTTEIIGVFAILPYGAILGNSLSTTSNWSDYENSIVVYNVNRQEYVIILHTLLCLPDTIF